MNKKISILAVASAMTLNLFSAIPASAESGVDLKVGDYVQMGTYYGQPILWRCVSFEKATVDSDGNVTVDATDIKTEYEDGYIPVMLSDKILCLKAYDASGSDTTGSHGRGYQSGKERKKTGSNYWADSNIRDWLNSDSDTVSWSCGNPPDKEHLNGGYNAYDSEAGFLTNFSDDEKNVIQTVTHKSLLDRYEYTPSIHGGYHKKNLSISNVVQNYSDAYSESVTDRMMFLDVKQINTVFNNSDILGNTYYIGKVTKECAENSEYKSSSLVEGGSWFSWLDSPDATTYGQDYVRRVSSAGAVDNSLAYNGTGGVRPAFYMNPSSSEFLSGDGSEEKPYSFKAILPEIDRPTQMPEIQAQKSADKQSATMRFAWEVVDKADAIENIGAYIVPFSIFDSENLENTALVKYDNPTIADGDSFSADLTNIPKDAFDMDIIAIPFVNEIPTLENSLSGSVNAYDIEKNR